MPPIGIDYTAAYEQGAGIGRYVRELIRALAAEDPETPYRLFVAGASRDRLPAQPGANFSWRPTRITPLWFVALWHRLRLPLPATGAGAPVPRLISPAADAPWHADAADGPRPVVCARRKPPRRC